MLKLAELPNLVDFDYRLRTRGPESTHHPPSNDNGSNPRTTNVMNVLPVIVGGNSVDLGR
jgi:hypothetical protein